MTQSPTLNIVLMDMSHANATSGVDRYMEMLVSGLVSHDGIHIVWLHLVNDPSLLLCKKEEHGGYTKVTCPLPLQYSEIIQEPYWIKQYNREIYRLAESILREFSPCVIHLHTLNLIDLAIYLRERLGGKIITHLHCIPWKGYLNTHPKRFTALYQSFYISERATDPQIFITHHGELRSYTESDHVICVTHCAKAFVEYVTAGRNAPITVLPNGLADKFAISPPRRSLHASSDVFHMLYVGVVSPSKGLGYILQAMRLVVRQGFHIQLSVAGSVTPLERRRIEEDYPELKVELLGRIPYQELSALYQRADCGIIASLQEQCSYVALEMCLFGLPIITTAVDGLDEIFTHESNALKVGTLFSRPLGLRVDVPDMARQIIRLIEDRPLRVRLASQARRLYTERFGIDMMVQRTIDVYSLILSNNE